MLSSPRPSPSTAPIGDRSFDCGSKVAFLAINVANVLERNDIAPAMRERLVSDSRRPGSRAKFGGSC
jgi:hypothetical protein